MSCSTCSSAQTRTNPGLVCAGSCGRLFHFKCVSVPSEIQPFLSKVPGLQWQCAGCSNSSISSNACAELDKMIDCKLNCFMESVQRHLDEFKVNLLGNQSSISKIVTSLNDKISEHNVDKKPSYSQKLLGQPSTKLLIMPKAQNQNSHSTEADLLSTIDPINSEIKITEVKHVNRGGLLLKCRDSTTPAELKLAAEQHLSDKYLLRELKSIAPLLKVVGISEHFTADNVLEYIQKQNVNLLSNVPILRLRKLWPTKKNKKVLQALIEVDSGTYNRLLEHGHVIVGFSSCTVFDAVSVLRCYKCNGFNHGSKFCKSESTCPKCAGPHDIKDCLADEKLSKCINCCRLKKRDSTLNIDTSHAAWNTTVCTAYLEAVSRLKTDVFSLGGSPP